MASNEAQKVIIDTDIGDDIDDALAIAYAVRRPELDVRAITTVYGPVEKRAEMVGKLLRLLGRDDIPFAAGVGRPLGELPADKLDRIISSVPNQYPFVKSGDSLPRPTAGGVDVVAKMIEASPGDIWLATIGPMTNAAVLIRDHPEAARKLKGIVCMAGETHLMRREYNIACDPEAARVVLRSGLVRFMGTWDVTRRVVMTDADMGTLRRVGTPLAEALVEMIMLWKQVERRKAWPVMYDMCPLTWLFAPDLFTAERSGVDVELAGPLARGLTIKVPGEPCLDISTGIQEATVLRMLMETLRRI